MPKILVGRRTEPDIAIAPEAVPVAVVQTPPPSPIAARTELFNRLHDKGFTKAQIKATFRIMTRLGNKAHAGNDPVKGLDYEMYSVTMDLAGHAAFDAVAKDQALPGEGSMHELLNAAFMPDGFTVIHDNRGGCVADALKLADARQLGIYTAA